MTDDSQSPSGKVQFIESHQPALEAGDYTITVTQQINIPKDVNHPDPVDETFKLKQEIQSFSVLGPRFTLDPQEIQAVFPPPGSLGEHSNVLPHIILKRSTLPWERPANGERDIPWLALLLFDEQEFSNLKIGDTEKKELLEKITRPRVKKLSEINQDGTVRFPPLLKKADPKPTNSPYWEMEFGDHADNTVTVIDVPADLLTAILPSKEELRLLTHVRQTADVNNNPQGDEVAVIICNRLPQKNGMSFVHLVSLEGRYGGNDFYYQGAKERDLIRLVSLYSRRFACVSEKHSFKGLLMHLNHQLLFNVGATNNRSELNKKNIPPEIRDAFEQSGHPEGASAKVTDCGQWKISTGNTYYVISDRLNVYNFAGRFLFKLAPNAISPDSFKKPSDVPQQPINDSFSNNKYSLGKDAVITAVQDHWWITTDQQDNQYIISQEKDTLYVHHLDLDSSSTLRLPRLISSDEKANELAEPYFAMGCVPLPHEMRQGNKSVSWYHGPLVPGEIPPIPPLFKIDLLVDLSLSQDLDALRLSFSEQSLELSYKAFLSVLSEDQRWLLHDGTDHYMIIKDVDAGKLDVFKELLPIRSGDELVRYNPTAGMFDVSYSAAWELGRLLTLQNKRVSVDLFNWKRSHAQSLKDAERQMDHLPFDIPTALDLPDSVRTWFTDLALLKDLPFNYLVPDERMLPTESIRFFQVDSSWVECLLDGAFSIGRVLPTDHEREGNLNVHPREEKKISGFLLRSDLVAGWPGLLVDGYSDGEANNPLALLRMDRLSKNVLLCLFEGLIQAVDIHLKPETLHFGVTPNDNDTGYIKKLKTQDASTVDITWKQLSNEDTKQQEEAAKKRVVDIASLVSSLEKELPKEAEEKEAMNSAQFALQMIEGVEKVRFMISK